VHYYRCYFVGKNGAPAAWRVFQSETDDEAHDHAIGLLVGFPKADKVEVWVRSRLTLSYKHSEAKTPSQLRRLCYLAIEASKKEADLEIKRMLAARAFALAQEAQAIEQHLERTSDRSNTASDKES
jgi:hypothetical protein